MKLATPCNCRNASCILLWQRATFYAISSEQTHIDFENKIEENNNVNMINYQYLYNGGGVGIGDFNNDKKPDIYFTSSFGPNKLYLNKGNFEFEDVTKHFRC